MEGEAQGQQILLRRTFTAGEPGGGTHLLVASTGSYNLYVNGRIAYSSLLFPGEEARRMRDIDVSAYVMPGDNVIAVWLAPGTEGGMQGEEKTMFSAEMYVRDGHGSMTFFSGTPWLWTEAGAVSLADGERTDGREELYGWYGMEPQGIVRWRPAAGAPASWMPAEAPWKDSGRADYTRRTIRPRYHSRADNGKSIVYDFGKGFYGLVRVTFRGARKGERVFLNGSEYICSGRTDEQFIGRFVPSGCRKLHIEGDGSFTADHVSAVEGVIISSQMP